MGGFKMKIYIFMIFFIISLFTFSETMTITYKGPESDKDTRFDYPLALIEEAMKKTKKEYGNYNIKPSIEMNFARAASARYIETLENFIFETSVSKENEENLLSIKIPITKGLTGYRIFLINKNKQKDFDKINSLDDLKKMSMGQGLLWNDIDILKTAGFQVLSAPDYEGLFRMVIRGRFDAFPRGINEAFQEQRARTEELPLLIVEDNICLYYPLPRFFYTAKKNKRFAERLKKGLEIMIDDGSFNKIWKEHNWKFIEQANLENRKIFTIDNPFVPPIVPLDNPKYWYKPTK
jgi:hypothetical protein